MSNNTDSSSIRRARRTHNNYPITSDASDEALPLTARTERCSDRFNKNYSTFYYNRRHDGPSPKTRWLNSLLAFSQACRGPQNNNSGDDDNGQAKTTLVHHKPSPIVVLVVLLGLYLGHRTLTTTSQRPWKQLHRPQPREEKWVWDYNSYHPQDKNSTDNDDKTTTTTLGNNNLLLSQITCTPTLRELGTISSRPNRAYARQWRRDYVECHEKHISTVVASLVRVNKHQQRYDMVVILSPDAIVTNLDYDLAQLLPRDKLVALSKGQQVLFFNLRHPEAKAVVDMWLKLSEGCGGNDAEMLRRAIRSVVGDDDEESLVHVLNETEEGFVGKDRVIKSISSAYSLEADKIASRAMLQSMADSVCYRYYPRCELL